jgi:hypothetical protein
MLGPLLTLGLDQLGLDAIGRGLNAFDARVRASDSERPFAAELFNGRVLRVEVNQPRTRVRAS